MLVFMCVLVCGVLYVYGDIGTVKMGVCWVPELMRRRERCQY